MDTNTDTDVPHLLTIPEAAAVLGVHEKRLRRLLAQPQYRDKVQHIERQTRTGTRQVAVATELLMAEMSLFFEKQRERDKPDTDKPDAVTQTTETTGTRPRKRNQTTDATQLLLTDREARIAELQRLLQLEQERGHTLMTELSAQRQARDQEGSEFRRLLLSQNGEIARLQQENRLLLAAPLVEDTTQETQEDHSAPQREQDDAKMVKHPLEPQTGVQRHWWEFWRR